LATVLGLLAAPVAAQTPVPSFPPSSDRLPVFRSGAELVALSVTVTDPQKRYVTGLTAEDFAVYEDGVRQEVEFFEAADVPLDLIILLDTSASMRDKLDVVHEAAIGFVRTLQDGDRGAIVGFSDTVTVLQDLTGDRTRLAQAVRDAGAHGGIALHNAIYVALKQFGRRAAQTGEVRRQAIAVLSDGADTVSLIGFDEVVAQARRSGVSIYTISIVSKYAAARMAASGERRYFSEADYEMKKLAQETGAQAFFPLGSGELPTAYASIAQDLSNVYSIGYAPKNTRSDARFRRIVVQVPGRPEARPRTRMGYVASADDTIAYNRDRQ
jgi:Ca-activated chloride channel family protein